MNCLQCHRTLLCAGSSPRSTATFLGAWRASASRSAKALRASCSTFFFSMKLAFALSDSFSSAAIKSSGASGRGSGGPSSSVPCNSSRKALKAAFRSWPTSFATSSFSFNPAASCAFASAQSSSSSASIAAASWVCPKARSCLQRKTIDTSGRRRALKSKFCSDLAALTSSLISSLSRSPNQVPSMMQAPQWEPRTVLIACTNSSSRCSSSRPSSSGSCSSAASSSAASSSPSTGSFGTQPGGHAGPSSPNKTFSASASSSSLFFFAALASSSRRSTSRRQISSNFKTGMW
mmetsp:Transcript_136479/g.340313  ORF Transcript_136479/g.340313 Transcript_136479/m.340313 type:complete len:291 (+) Transcript_136479:1869-2741(+)